MGVEVFVKPAVCWGYVCWVDAVPKGVVWRWKENLHPKRRLGFVRSIDKVKVIQVRIELGTECSYQQQNQLSVMSAT